MTKIPAPLRALVVERADNRCEYCGISQLGQVATFQIGHIIPVVAGGKTTAENLALACVSCSLRKGARQKIQDLETQLGKFHTKIGIWRARSAPNPYFCVVNLRTLPGRNRT